MDRRVSDQTAFTFFSFNLINLQISVYIMSWAQHMEDILQVLSPDLAYKTYRPYSTYTSPNTARLRMSLFLVGRSTRGHSQHKLNDLRIIISLRKSEFRPTVERISLGWLVGCFGFNGPLRQYFSLYRAVSQREGERGEKG